MRMMLAKVLAFLLPVFIEALIQVFATASITSNVNAGGLIAMTTNRTAPIDVVGSSRLSGVSQTTTK